MLLVFWQAGACHAYDSNLTSCQCPAVASDELRCALQMQWQLLAQSRSGQQLRYCRHGSKVRHAIPVHPGVIYTERGRTLPPRVVKQPFEPLQALEKNAGHGAATTAWAALSSELGGKGGVCCEDRHIAEQASADGVWRLNVISGHIYCTRTWS